MQRPHIGVARVLAKCRFRFPEPFVGYRDRLGGILRGFRLDLHSEESRDGLVSQAELARLVGVTRETISRIENGAELPSPATAEKLLVAFEKEWGAIGVKGTGCNHQPFLDHERGRWLWDYSNIGFALLGYLGSRIVGHDFRRWTHEHIFEAIGLNHTAWLIAETPAPLRVTPYDLVDDMPVPVGPVGFPDWPAGMIRSSILDMTRLSAIVANRGRADGQRILSASSVGEMLRMQRPAGLPTWLNGQGLAWQQSPLGGKQLANHWGGDPGVFTMTYVDAGKQTAVTILSNVSATTGSREALKTIVSAAFAAF